MTDAPTPIEDLLVTLGLAHGSRPVHLTPGEAGSLLARPAFHGLTALLGAAVDTGDVRVDIATSGEVTRGWAEAMARAVELDGLLLEVCAALAQAGIPTRVLKGAAVATLDEPDPAWRSYQDVDVLVPANRLMAAADALAPLGLQPAVPPVRRGWADRHAKSLTLRHHSGMQVDLHRRLAGGPLGARIRTDALFAGGDDLPVGTATLTALVAEHRFLHACYHAVLGGTRGPRHRRDVLLLARRVSPEAVEVVEKEAIVLTLVDTRERRVLQKVTNPKAEEEAATEAAEAEAKAEEEAEVKAEAKAGEKELVTGPRLPAKTPK